MAIWFLLAEYQSASEQMTLLTIILFWKKQEISGFKMDNSYTWHQLRILYKTILRERVVEVRRYNKGEEIHLAIYTDYKEAGYNSGWISSIFVPLVPVINKNK